MDGGHTLSTWLKTFERCMPPRASQAQEMQP